MPESNNATITFDDERTSVENIVAALKKGNLTINGKPVMVK